jgi:hypothetical protein
MAGLEGIFNRGPVTGVARPAGESKIDHTVGASGAVRTQLAGGWLTQLALHSSLQPIEQLYRKLPSDGIYSATPSHPFTIEMGTYTVPANMVLFVLDWRFDLYKPNGAIVGDTRPVPDRSWSLSIGWDVLFSDKHQGVNNFEITPALPPAGVVDQQPNFGFPSPDDAFTKMRALNTQLPGGAGGAMLPQRHRRDVQVTMPFTYILEANQNLRMRMIAINPVSIALAFFEAEFSGLIVPANAFKRFIAAAAPAVEFIQNP